MLRFARKKERRTDYEDKLAGMLQYHCWREDLFGPDEPGTYMSPLRYVAVVSIPWLDRSSHELQCSMYGIMLRLNNWYRVWRQYSAETLRKDYQVIQPGTFRRIQDGHRVHTGPWRNPLLPRP